MNEEENKKFFGIGEKASKVGKGCLLGYKTFMKKLNTITEERGLFLPLCCYWQLRAWAW